MRLRSSAIELVAGVGLTANTDGSRLARVVAWMDADVDDSQRFPMRTLAASDEPLLLPTPAESDAAIAAFEVDGEALPRFLADMALPRFLADMALPRFLADDDTTTFLVVHDGELVYGNCHNDSSREAI